MKLRTTLPFALTLAAFATTAWAFAAPPQTSSGIA